MSHVSTERYSHIQTASLYLILYLLAIIAFGVVFTSVADPVGVWIAGSVGLLLAVFATAFQYLKVSDEGDALQIQFGPLPLFQRRVRYSDIASAEPGRTQFIEGWGIHYSLSRGGWVWNLWGFDCVEVRFKTGSVLRIGTDDPTNLSAFIQSRLN